MGLNKPIGPFTTSGMSPEQYMSATSHGKVTTLLIAIVHITKIVSRYTRLLLGCTYSLGEGSSGHAESPRHSGLPFRCQQNRALVL